MRTQYRWEEVENERNKGAGGGGVGGRFQGKGLWRANKSGSLAKCSLCNCQCLCYLISTDQWISSTIYSKCIHWIVDVYCVQHVKMAAHWQMALYNKFGCLNVAIVPLTGSIRNCNLHEKGLNESNDTFQYSVIWSSFTAIVFSFKPLRITFWWCVLNWSNLFCHKSSAIHIREQPKHSYRACSLLIIIIRYLIWLHAWNGCIWFELLLTIK